MNSMSRQSADSFPDDDDDDVSREESSWTMYFEDFSNNKNNGVMDEENSCFCSDHINYYQTSSLVSDAACSVTRHVFGASNNNNNNRFSFKKRKKKVDNKGILGLVEDDLEDTASSPANSPKVCNMVNHFDKKHKEVMDKSDQEKGSGSRQMDERNNDGDGMSLNIGRENNEGTHQLKKRGLCLVPLSMVVHYLG